ncbi:paramyosin-like isoform X2 [Oscarella lobularis]
MSDAPILETTGSLRDRIRAMRDEFSKVADAMELFALSGERCRTKEAEQVRPAELLSRLSAFSSKNIEILAIEMQKQASANGKDKLERDEVGGKLIDIAEKMTSLRHELVPLVDAKSLRETKLQRELSDLRYALSEAKRGQEDYRKRFDTATRSCGVAETTISTLKSQLKEKTDEVGKLKRNANVCLWEREKTRLLDEAEKRIKQLEEELKEATDANENLRKMYEDVKSMLKKANMRAELNRQHYRGNDDESVAESEKLKQALYVREKNVAAALSTAKELQKQFIGILNGLQFDYRALKATLNLDPDSREMSEAVRYQEMLELLRESCASGTLNSVRASLPEHYIGVQSDVKAFSPEVLKLSDQMRRRSLSSRSGEREAVNGVPLDEVLKHSAMAEKLSSQAVATNAESKQMSRGTEARHPELIDKRTGMVKMEECQRYFPAMTQGQ